MPSEITKLFEDAYHLKKNPRFSLLDYDITNDRSISPAPPEQGKTQNTKNLRRLFSGVIEIDGQEHKIKGVGNGAISSLANALKTLGIDWDVADYKEHAIGEGREVKAATYIECTAANSSQKVWGVGIHEDVVQASLIALLSAASSVWLHPFIRLAEVQPTNFQQFLSSRPSTPIPFRPKRSNTLDLSSPELSPLRPSGTPESRSDSAGHLVAHLETRVDGTH